MIGALDLPFRHCIDTGELSCVPLRATETSSVESEERAPRGEGPDDLGWVLGEEGKRHRLRILREAFDSDVGLVALKNRFPSFSWHNLTELAVSFSELEDTRVTPLMLLCMNKSWQDDVIGVDGFAARIGVRPEKTRETRDR
jgi:hypothetical protein